MTFWFNPLALRSGEKIIQNAPESKADFLIIDELGPLELNELVWYSSIKGIVGRFNKTLIICIRKGLVNEIIFKFDLPRPRVLDITKVPADKAASLILKSK